MRQAQFLKTLERLRFSGQLTLSSATGQEWVMYMAQGRILYATGGVHPVRRWRRNLMIYCPQVPTHQAAWQHALVNVDESSLVLGWEYALLSSWVVQQKITPKQALNMIGATVVEILFDVTQTADVKEQITMHPLSPVDMPSVEVGQAIAITQRMWSAWKNAMLGQYSPNKAPVIRQAEQLQKSKLAQHYNTFVDLLDGQQTLRDIAVKIRRDVLKTTSSLLPCLHLGWIGLIDIPDLPPPNYPQVTVKQGDLIACIDDSRLVHQTLEKLLTSAGYRFIGIQDPLRAMGILLKHRPKLIFLDLVMPNINGYEICQQLRKLSFFQETPIVILTGNDGFTNRIRSNFVGASDFLGKPLEAEKVLSVIRKHLKQGVAQR
ncbi:MAG TPA: response regulator [Crinalium sp.]